MEMSISPDLEMATPTDIAFMTTTSNSSLAGVDEETSSEKVFTIVLYVLVGTIGIVGNTLVCIVFGLMRSRRSQVNLFIFHQAFVDLLTSCLLILFGITQLYREEIMNTSTITVVVPPSNTTSSSSSNVTSLYDAEQEQEVVVIADIPFALAEFMCRLWWGRVFLFSMFVISTFNLTTMAIERYFAIMHPFLYATKFRRRHALVAIVFIWLMAPSMQYFPPIFQYHAFADTHECGDQPTWTSEAQAALGVCLIAWEFFMPCFIMGYSSIRIYRKLRRRDTYLVNSTIFRMKKDNVNARPPRDKDTDMIKANRNTTMVVISIFAVYIVCWAPNHITFLGFNLGMELDFGGKWYQTTVLLAFVNSCINPFIYAIRLKAFQRGLVHICRKGCHVMNSANFDSTAMMNHYDVNASML